MFIKKFYGQRMKAILEEAKREMGEDLVILSQKALAGGRIELTVATERKQEPWPWDRGALEEEIGSIKEMLLSLVEAEEVRKLGKAALCLYRELKGKGMSEAGAYQVVRQLCQGMPAGELVQKDSLEPELLQWFSSRIVSVDPLGKGKLCLALLGRTGVGKTTTMAKLASMERYLHRRTVALLSLDAWKVASREELQRIGKLLGVPTGVAYERKDIQRFLELHAQVDTVFVDTPGRDPEDRDLRERIFDVMALCPHAEGHLLLSPQYQRSVLLEDLERYGKLPLKSLILTKLDEKGSLGGLMEAVMVHGIPVSWMTTGQDIPNDIHPVNQRFLIERMMEN
ncbi:MAG: hypothetical protein AB1640_10680 [bacterium]